MAIANKKSIRNTNDEIICAYIHTVNKLGNIIEIHCETEFVTKRVKFSQLAKNIAI